MEVYQEHEAAQAELTTRTEYVYSGLGQRHHRSQGGTCPSATIGPIRKELGEQLKTETVMSARKT